MTAELINPTITRLPSGMGRLNLTGAHLREGVPGDDCLCAAAVGLLDTLGLPDGLARVTVTEEIIDLRISELERRWWAAVPDDLADFIDDFDQTDDDEELLRRMLTAAGLGLYQYTLTWHPGQPPEDDG